MTLLVYLPWSRASRMELRDALAPMRLSVLGLLLRHLGTRPG